MTAVSLVHTPTSSPEDARKRLLSAPAALAPCYPERQEILDDLVAALVAGEHVVLVGPPGTAKSELVRAWSVLCGATYFEYLLTPFTEPNELFGPVDIEGFRAGEYRRVMDGMAPAAELLFLDEAFKASSAILNSLLALLNERIYHSGRQIVASPLQSAILASNEYPDGRLTALWDRCLVRHEVRYLQHADNLKRLVTLGLPKAPTEPLTSVQDALDVREVARKVAVPKATEEALLGVYKALGGKSIVVSDRRKVRVTRYLQAVAALEGSLEVTDDHVARLSAVLWEKHQQQDELAKVLEQFAAQWRTKLREGQRGLEGLRKELESARMPGVKLDLNELARVNKEAKAFGEKQAKALSRHTHRPGVEGFLAATRAFVEDTRAFVTRAAGGGL